MVRSRAQPGPDVKPTGVSHRCIILGSVCFLATSQEEHARNLPHFFFFCEPCLFFWEGSASRMHGTSRSLTYFQQECLNRKLRSQTRLLSLHPPHPFYQTRAMGDVIPVPTFTPQKPG